MRSLDYKLWAQYITDLIDLYPGQRKKILEVAAGSGQVSKFLKSKFSKYFIIDLSFDMISKSPKEFTRIVGRMESLPFKKDFDVIFSIFDSVNYLVSSEDFLSHLFESSNILTPDGILLFDVSLENNSKKNINLLNRSGSFKGIKFKQISTYDSDLRIHKNYIEMKINGKVFSETHLQRIYKFDDYFEFADRAGMIVLDAFDCFTFEDATDESERVQFVLGKRDAHF